jgi:hypothetical protein
MPTSSRRSTKTRAGPPSRLSGWSCARRRARFCALRSDPAGPPQRGCRGGGPGGAGPPDLDGVCAQLANLALT